MSNLTPEQKLVAHVYQKLGMPRRLALESNRHDAERAAAELLSAKSDYDQKPVYTPKYLAAIFDWAQEHQFWVKFITSLPALAKALLHPENPDGGLEAQYEGAQRLGKIAEDGYTLKRVPVAKPDCPICHGDRDVLVNFDISKYKDPEFVQAKLVEIDAKPWSQSKKKEVKEQINTFHLYALKGLPYRGSRYCTCVQFETRKVFVGTDE